MFFSFDCFLLKTELSVRELLHNNYYLEVIINGMLPLLLSGFATFIWVIIYFVAKYTGK